MDLNDAIQTGTSQDILDATDSALGGSNAGTSTAYSRSTDEGASAARTDAIGAYRDAVNAAVSALNTQYLAIPAA